MSHHYSHLLSPGRIAGIECRNSIVRVAICTNCAGADGQCTGQPITYCEARARRRARLLVLETSAALWPCPF